MASAPQQDEGLALFRSVLAPSQLQSWRSVIDARYREVESARREGGSEAVARLIPPGERFVPTASSLTAGAVLEEEEWCSLLAELGKGAVGAWVREELRDQVACDRDQAWVRRQYAPGRYPRWHAPHGWHQDGALGFKFQPHTGAPVPADALLPMVTCWIALTPCGVEAPGLELIRQRPEGLLTPVELTDECVQARFGPPEFWRPEMEPGDALLFRGDLLHRTHVSPEMTRDRTSIELRFFPENRLPARLQGDRFIRLN